MNKLRVWEKGCRYPQGTFFLHTEDKKPVKSLRKNGPSGMIVCSDNGKDVAWDVICPPGNANVGSRLKNTLLAQCG